MPEATRAAWPCPAIERLDKAGQGPVALPVAVGVACAGHGIALAAALHAFLHALAANWISAGVRLIPLGQTDGQRLLAALEPAVDNAAAHALATPLEEVGTCASAPISPACATRRNTRGCSEAEDGNG